jgi:hypothetical protein
MISIHTHTRDYYRKFSETTSLGEPLVPKRITPTLSKTCTVHDSSPACETGTGLDPAQPQQPNSVALFVSTELSCWQTDRPDAFNLDVQINDTAYRRLDPEYYAWLRSRMNMVRLAALAGQVSQDSFDELRANFNRIHEWAMVHCGEAALKAAVAGLDARDYKPPIAEPWDRHSAQPAPGTATTHPDVLAMVDAIREQAIALGWQHERLYATGPLCGLASYLKPDDRIGQVTREAIEIIARSGARQRFYNPDVEQPWIRREEN